MSIKERVQETVSNCGLALTWEGEHIIKVHEILCDVMHFCKDMSIDFDAERFYASNQFDKETRKETNVYKQLDIFDMDSSATA
tara:strand:+ start:503 stop:751 length:249 start_codon:yes stop_codon:yes gene_type:complete